MKRILIHMRVTDHSEYDIFKLSTHEELQTFVNEQNGGNCPNFGNRLWFQGLMSEIQSADTVFEIFDSTMTKEEINERYDMIVAPMANVFAIDYAPLLESLAARFEGIRIPVYVIACGIQAGSYDELDDIIRAVGPQAKKFISNVYNTGGEFALRGYFTKEFFERLGFSSAVVTGCPSMFQLGRNLQVTQEKKPLEQFKVGLNGTPSDYKELFKQYPTAEFFDQNTYYHQLLNTAHFEGNTSDSVRLKQWIKMYGLQTSEWLLEDRIRLIPNMNQWRHYLQTEQFTLSYGSRIHGSIMPILSGVPAVLESRDARTKEMAEFFDIPCVQPEGYREYGSLYGLYENIDYTAFNKGFAARFDAYESFLRKCGIVEKINENNPFFYEIDELLPLSTTVNQRAAMRRMYEAKSGCWRMYAQLLLAKRKLFSR